MSDNIKFECGRISGLKYVLLFLKSLENEDKFNNVDLLNKFKNEINNCIKDCIERIEKFKKDHELDLDKE